MLLHSHSKLLKNIIMKFFRLAKESVKFVLLTIFFAVIISLTVTAQESFKENFYDRTLRLTYSIFGDSTSCKANFNGWSIIDGWSGKKKALDICHKESDMMVLITDKATKRIIYRNSYSSLFCEWQTMCFNLSSGEFKEGVMIPFPKHPSIVSVIRNYKSGLKQTLLDLEIDLEKLSDIPSVNKRYPVESLQRAKTSRSIDIVFLPEGYTAKEMDKFLEAAQKMATQLFEYEPFSNYKRCFNINAVLAPSPESGIDIPSENIERKTLMDFSYDTFGIERYIGTSNYWSVSELASNTSWSYAIILVNSEKYGGGGIYNFYSVFPGGNSQILELFVHEFGHAFAALDDEYEEPGNALVPLGESNRDCIMKTLSTHYYCGECKKKVESVIKRR